MGKFMTRCILLFIFFSLNLRAQDYAIEWAFNPKDSIVLGGDIYGTKSKVNPNTGDIYVIGYFYHNVKFDLNETYNLSSTGAYDIFLAKYNSNGNLLWTKNMGGGDNEYAYDLAINDEGEIYITGSFRLLARFNEYSSDGLVYSNGTSDIFLAKFDTDGNFIWVESVSSTLNATGIGVVIDTFGDIYLTGDYSGSATFGGFTETVLTSTVNRNIFLAKYDSNGNFFWVKNLGGTSDGSVRSLEINDNNEIFISGIFWGIATFQSFSISSDGEADIFLAKFTTEGNCVWAHSMGGTSDDYVYDMAVDSDNNIIIVGSYDGTAYFDPNSNVNLNSTSSFSSVFISKYTSAGNYIWAKSIDNENGTRAYGVTTDISNNVILTGRLHGSNTFNNPSNEELTAIGQYNTYIASYNPNGEYIWAINFGGTSINSGNSVTMDENNNIVLLSQFSDTVNYDFYSTNEFYSGLGVTNYVIAKYSSVNGNFIWAQMAGGIDGGNTTENQQSVADIKVDYEGNVIIAGSFKGKVDFNKSETIQSYLQSNGGYDCFIAKYDSDGNYIWALSFGGDEDDFIQCLTINEFGNIYVAGSFRDTVNIGPNPSDVMMAIPNTTSMFFAQFNSNGSYNWSNYHSTQSDGANASSITIDSNNNLYITGKFWGSYNFDANGDATYSSLSHTNTFIAKYDNNGDFIWLNHLESNSNSGANDITIDSENNIFVTGNFKGTIIFNPQGDTINTSLDVNSIYIVKYDSDGNFIWANSASGAITQSDAHQINGVTLTTDNDGNCYIAGGISGNIIFSDDSQIFNLVTYGWPDIFLAKYSPAGTILWVDSYGDEARDYVSKITIHNNNLYIIGQFEETINFNSENGQNLLISKGRNDVFLGKFDLEGNVLITKQIGDLFIDYSKSLCISDDAIYLTGMFYTKTDMDPSLSKYILSSSNSSDIFILKLSPCVPPEVNVLQSGVQLTVENPNLYYQWYKCNPSGNVLLTGETSQSFTASQNGSYSVMVSEDGCTQWSDCFQVVNVGVKELDINEILVYPNPTNDKLFVKLNSITNLEIYSITGALIERFNNEEFYEIDVSNYSNGIYLLKSMNQVVKFVKE